MSALVVALMVLVVLLVGFGAVLVVSRLLRAEVDKATAGRRATGRKA